MMPIRSDHDDDGQPRRDAEDAQRRGHADELGDQGQPVGQHQVEQRKPAPEGAEGVEDGLGVAALGDRAQPDRHLLDVVGDRAQQDQEPDQAVAVLRAGRGIGGDAAGVVVGNHHHQPGPASTRYRRTAFQPR